MSARESHNFSEIARAFLKLGASAFGGPAVHVALMEEEFVRRRAWLDHATFLDLWAACQLIPGPNSTEMAMHIGHHRAGWRGLLVAGLCFITPAVLIVMGLAWLYKIYGSVTAVSGILYGIKPVVIAVIAQALWTLSAQSLKSKMLFSLALLVLGLAVSGADEIGLILFSGLTWALLSHLIKRRGAPVSLASVEMISLSALFWFFLKIGSLLYGSGYVLIAYLRSGLTQEASWLTEAQLLDAVAVGQVTPGPVFTTATFVGYLLGGPVAALVATLGIFLPSFLLVGLSAPLLPRMRRSSFASHFLDGVSVASIAIMALACLQLAHTAMIDPLTISLATISAVLLIRFRVNSVALILMGAACGLLHSLALGID